MDAGLPVRAALHPAGLFFALRQIPPAELRDAFLFETVARVPAAETIVRADTAPRSARPIAAPAGLIFHLGRCGSTVISQCLKTLDDAVIYSEPQAVNEILVPPHTASRDELIVALRALSSAFARHAQKPFVFKFSSWNALFCDIVVDAFPDTPWIVNVRDPIEVVVSTVSVLPGWFDPKQDPARALARIVDPEGASKSYEEYSARAYGALCQAIENLDPRKGRLVSYESLPSAIWDKVAPHFLLSVDDDDRNRMAREASLYSKSRLGAAKAFVNDSAVKRAGASPALREAVETFARPALARLNARFQH